MQLKLKSNIDLSEISETPPHVGEARRIFRVMFGRWLVIFGTVVILLLVLTAAFAPLIAPYDPIQPDMAQSLQQPSNEHLLGTDRLGRDVLSRVIYGSRVSLWVGVISISLASIIGISMGMAAGFFGRFTNNIIMRITDALMAIPPIVLAMAIAALLGGGLRNVSISIGISMLPTYCRLMCSQVLSIRASDYIIAALSTGASPPRIMGRHLLPNSFPPLLVLITLNMGTAILAEASLSFLGIGIAPPEPTWGGMVSDGYRYLITNPVLSLAPGIVILLVVLAFNMVGDGLRDALDPRLRGVV
jgi:peptide/nickel transport system permease protein